MLIVRCFRRRIVSNRGPRGERKQQSCILQAMQGMALTGVECDQRPGLALHGFGGSFDRDPSGNHLHNRSLANVMVAHPLSATKVERHHSAFGRCEQDTRILMTQRGNARGVCFGWRSTRFSDDGAMAGRYQRFIAGTSGLLGRATCAQYRNARLNGSGTESGDMGILGSMVVWTIGQGGGVFSIRSPRRRSSGLPGSGEGDLDGEPRADASFRFDVQRSTDGCDPLPHSDKPELASAYLR